MFRIRSYAFLVVLAAVVALSLPAVVQSQARESADPTDTLFDDTVLHEIRLTISSRDWESLKVHFRENTRYPADLRWRDTRGREEVVRNIGIRSRGNGSRSGSKPGLKFDINYYSTDKRFLGMKNLVLRNNTQDASNMRELISMKFFRRMQIKAPRESFARLFVNESYAGLYTIVEDIDKDFLQRNFDENDGHLYEYDFDEESRIPFAFEYLGSDPASYVPMPFKPETHENDPRGDVLERFIWTINDGNSASWRQRMEEYLNLNEFVQHLGIENFLAEEDGISGDYGPNNFYIYRFQNTNRFKFLPWDKSNTFWETPDYWVFRNIRDGEVNHRNRLVLAALSYRDLLDMYLDTLLKSADSGAETENGTNAQEASGPGWLEREVNRAYNLIRSAARSDTVKPYSNEDFEASVELIKTFARERSEAVRRMVADERR